MTRFEEAVTKTAVFKGKHNLQKKNMALMASSEVGELSEAVLKDDYDEVKEEIGDVMFTVVVISLLYGIDPSDAYIDVANENLDKNASREGDKITKD